MKTWAKAILAGVLALGPAGSFAAIDNTHHDMPYLGASQERCAFCHAKVGLATPVTGNLGKVGNFCVLVCHMSGAGLGSRVGVIPTSPGTYTFGTTNAVIANNVASPTVLEQGHGMEPTGFTSNPGEMTNIANTGWPYTVAGSSMQCTSCHAVHDASNPPFLNAKLSGAAPLDPQTESFCQRCHNSPTRIEDFLVQAGDHPTEFVWDTVAASTRTATKTGDSTVMNRRRLANNVPTIINVTATDGGTPLADNAPTTALNATSASWNLGGHVVNPATGLPTSGGSGGANQFGCYSCHAVHNNVGDTGWVDSGLGNPQTVGSDGTDVCYGCHSVNPGMTAYGHPIDYEVPLNHTISGGAWEAVPIVATAMAAVPANFRPAQVGGRYNAPYCVTCHDVHGGKAGRMAIRSEVGFDYPTGSTAVCEICHSSGATYGNPTTPNKHHPGATATNYTAAAAGLFPANASWRTQDGLGYLDDGLSCGDCHVGDGTPSKRATAHNWQ